MNFKKIIFFTLLLVVFNNLNAQKNYDKQFFKNFYYKNSSDYSINLDYEDESDLLTGTIISIIPYNNKNDIGYEGNATINIMYTSGAMKGRSIPVVASLKSNKIKCNECIELIDKLKIGTKVKFKTIKVGNGLGRTFWFTYIQI